MSIELAASLCLPLVMTSQPWPSVAPQAATWIGVKFARKSPESWSTKRQRPSEVWPGVSAASSLAEDDENLP